MKSTVAILVFLLFTSCQSTKKNKLSQDTLLNFTKVYSDYLICISTDSLQHKNRQIILDSLLQRQNMTHEEFNAALTWLEDEPQQALQWLDAIDTRLDSLAKQED